MNKLPLEITAPIIATSVAFFLAIMKFIVWIISWSVTLMSSAMDSLLDTGVSIFNYFAIKFAIEPADSEHNYWHWKIEWIAATIQWTIITLSWFYIIYESIKKILNPEPINHINWALLVMFISIIVTWWLVFYLNYVYKKTKNLVIKGDSLHYKIDVFTNLAVILVLVILYFFPSLAWIDWIIGGLIWLYIIKESYNLIKEWVKLLLDTAIEEHLEVKKIIEGFVINKSIKWFHDFKTRYSWSKDKFVEFHYILSPETTILEAHNIWDKIEEKIKKIDIESKWHFAYHVDYFDDSKK